jgi:hypothetical protein
MENQGVLDAAVREVEISLKLWQRVAIASHTNSLGFESKKISQITYRQRLCQRGETGIARHSTGETLSAEKRERILSSSQSVRISAKWYVAGEKRR